MCVGGEAGNETMQWYKILIQWNLSNADTIGTTHVCLEYGGSHISRASGSISARRGNTHSGCLV